MIAGLEPTETNLLLQALGKAVEQKLDSSKYVAQLNRSTTKAKQTTNKGDGDKAKKSSTSVKEITSSKHKKKDSPKINQKKDNLKSKKHSENVKTPDKVVETKEKKNELETEKNVTPKSSNENILENALTDEKITNNTDETVVPGAANENHDKINMPSEVKEDDKITNSKDDNHVDDDNNNKKNSLIRPKSARPKSAAKDQNLIVQKDFLLEKNVFEVVEKETNDSGKLLLNIF